MPSNYICLYQRNPIPDNAPYRILNIGGEQSVEFDIPPGAYNNLENKDIYVTISMAHFFRGITNNVGYYTPKFDFSVINTQNTKNDTYTIFYSRSGALDSVQHNPDKERMKCRISGKPDKLRMKYERSDGLILGLATFPCMIVLKFSNDDKNDNC